MRRSMLFSAVVALATVVWLSLPGAAYAAVGTWSAGAAARGGEDDAEINGSGACTVKGVWVNGKELPRGSYAVDGDGTSRPKIHFCQPLKKGDKVVVRGETTKKGSHSFGMRLR